MSRFRCGLNSMMLLFKLITIILTLVQCEAFSIPSKALHTLNQGKRRQTFGPLRVIKAEESDFVFDQGAGGVRLATESVIKVTGAVKHKPGKAEANLKNLLRYTSLSPVKESTVKEILEKSGGTILCTGKGKELYKDPGETSEAVIVLAPHDAIRDAMYSAGSAMQAAVLVLNFAGGDDSQVLEVMEAAEDIAVMLDVPTKATIILNSISSSNFPSGTSTITSIAFPEELSTSGLNGVDRSISVGELYFVNGEYYTLVEENINTAIA